MIIRRLDDGRIQLGDETVSSLTEARHAVRALKKPIPIMARRMDVPFQVETTEGLMKGNAGDYLMQGVSGELYICPAAIFLKSYDILRDESLPSDT